jgi:hypothetical protein
MDRALLRHLLATLAYRATKVLRDVPAGFDRFQLDSRSRRPVQIVAHMADLMEWGTRLASGEYKWDARGGEQWDVEVGRFLHGMRALDDAIVAHAPTGADAEKLIQGPLADALTHVGQLAMLRGAAGAAVRPESYARAEILPGRLGLEQAAPQREFDGDASARKE